MPKTTAMNISLPESMRDWVISQTENGQYSNNSDVVRDLIRKEQHRQEKIRRLQEAVDKGLASGVARDFDMEAVIEKMEKEQAAKYLRELNEKFVLIAEQPTS